MRGIVGDVDDAAVIAAVTEAGYTIFASDTPPGMTRTLGTQITVNGVTDVLGPLLAQAGR